jgi:hypothetical protein
MSSSLAVALGGVASCTKAAFLSRFVLIGPFYHEFCTHWKGPAQYDLSCWEPSAQARRNNALPDDSISGALASLQTFPPALPAAASHLRVVHLI